MRKLDVKTFEPYFLSDDIEKDMWQNCIFVFDTSALLNFYEYSDATKTNLFDTIFRKVNERLWIPHHVEYEYFKNRESAIKKVIERKYTPLKSENIAKIQAALKEIKNRLTDFQNRVKITSENTHPDINEGITTTFVEKFNEFEKAFQEFETQVEKEIQIQTKAIETTEQNDILLNAMKEFFEVGDKYSYPKIMEIITEGEFRYRNEIPPGYKDFNDKKKKGIQKYGDLIVWKQILDYVSSLDDKKPIVLVTSELKEDWSHIKEEHGEKRIEMPQEDLIREIYDLVEVKFWMYTLKQFVYKAKTLLNTDTKEEVLDEVNKVEREKINIENSLEYNTEYSQKINEINRKLREFANPPLLQQVNELDRKLREPVLQQINDWNEKLKELSNPPALQEINNFNEKLREFANPPWLRALNDLNKKIKELSSPY